MARLAAVLISSAAPPARPDSKPKPIPAAEPTKQCPSQQMCRISRHRQQRTKREAARNHGSAHADSDDGAGPDELVPDPEVCREFNISSMTLWRWDHDIELDFPPPIVIRKRKFRIRRQLEEFKRRMLRNAIAQRAGVPFGPVLKKGV
jgi:hypothetical protein